MSLAVLSNPDNSFAKTINYTGQEIVLKVSIQKMTEVKFTGAQIASVILGFKAEDISIQNAGGNLIYLQPLNSISGHLFIVLDSGRSVMLTLVSVPEEIMDKKVEVVIADSNETERIEKIKSSGLTPAGLIKVMITGNLPDGIIVSKKSIKITDNLIAEQIYDAGYMQGYSGQVPYNNFDISQITAKGLIAGAVRDGKFYLVFYKTEVK